MVYQAFPRLLLCGLLLGALWYTVFEYVPVMRASGTSALLSVVCAASAVLARYEKPGNSCNNAANMTPAWYLDRFTWRHDKTLIRRSSIKLTISQFR